MTLAEVWDVLDAAEQVARVHRCACKALLTTRRVVQIQLWRGLRLAGAVELSAQQIEQCADVTALRALVEREVAAALAALAALA